MDKATGEFTEIGPTGHTNWMDLAFDFDKYNVLYGKGLTISMNALPAHLAHGDYVPGSVGHDCDCP